MNLLRNYSAAIVVAMTVVLASCGGGPIEHGTEYILECSADADTADIRAAYLVIEKRLNNFGLDGDFEMSRNANRVTIRVRQGSVADRESMRRVLQSSANLTFRAMFKFGEIAPAISDAHQAYLRLNHIDSANASGAGFAGLIAASSNDPDAPLIFSCRAKDTAAVMNILRTDSIAMLFNSDVVFHWGTGPELENGERSYGLFACKAGRNYEMDGNSIESASALMNSNTASWEISLVFDPVGSREFARITKANVGRNVGIELDDYVYSYPLVNSEITGGVAVISGDFTEAEAGDLAKVLSAGQIPVPFRIVQESDF